MMEKKQYRVGAYLRLSKGDGDVDGVEKSESNSISSQRLIIGRYLEGHPEMVTVDTYIDDGYTGTNFKRPELERLMHDVDEGKVDCIVCKDLSRWGRERIETGNYISRIFRDKGVRFIAVNDHYDSLTATGSDNHLVMPIKALTNDSFSRDISLKVRSSQSVKRERGEYIAPFAPYGYKKDPENVNHLVIDEPAAKVVRRIFAMRIEGASANEIASELTAEGIPTPAEHMRRNGIKIGRRRSTSGSAWQAGQVIRILKSETYLGSTVQGKSTKVSYKVNRIIKKPREEWSIVEGKHEPVVSRDDFRIVQSLLERDTIKRPGGARAYLFSGLLYCGDCGSPMYRRISAWKDRKTIYYICSNYNNRSRGSEGCTRHSIQEEDLKDIVKDTINHTIRELCKYDELSGNLEKMHISREDAMDRDQDILRLKTEIEKCAAMKASLYQDLKEGLISGEQFERYRAGYTDRERALSDAVRRQEELIRKIYENGIAAETLLEQFRENPKVDELNRRLLVSLIDRILVYEDKKVDILCRYADEMEKCASIIVAAQ